MGTRAEDLQLGTYQWGWHDEHKPVFEPKRGLSEDVVREISALKDEPKWMLDLRLKSLKHFQRRPMPDWGGDLSGIDFDNIFYFVRSTEQQATTWDELPAEIKETYDRLGLPEAEKQRLVSGIAAQYESEVVYHKVREDLEEQGVIFLDTDTALKQHPDLFREHYTKVIPANDNKFAALNTAVWSGGSFIWVPEGVKVDIPLQAYFRINQQNMGQFERTLIIAEPGSYVHYVEGCLPAGELIGTADGDWRGIETIKVGDHVLTHEGRPARVTAVQIRDHRGPLYSFRPMSPDSAFRVTGEHPLLVARDSGEPDWIEAKDVREGDQLVFPKPKPAPAETILPLSFARLAGYYLAFGSATIVDGTKRILFSLPADDGEPLEEIRRLSKDLYEVPGALVWDESTQQVSVVVESATVYEALRHLGTGAADKRLPSDLYRQDTKFHEALLETYLRGHECAVHEGAIEHRAETLSRTWARQLQAVLARVGVFASVSSRQDVCVVEWATGGRDTRRARDAGDYFVVPIAERTVEEFDGQVYNLDVEAPDSYLAAGFAVHNCTAPVYSSDSLHSAVVEIIAKPGARVRYTTIQNWSNNVYNLVTKRAAAYEDSVMEWVDANIGSKLTMKYPAVWLMGRGARGEVLSVAYAGDGQHQDAGAKMVHHAPDTSSTIVSKSVSKGVGRTSYRGLVDVQEGANRVKSNVVCDALLLDETARSDTYPYMTIREDDAQIGHEASVSKVGDEQLFYLRSRGIEEFEALAMIVRGFIEPISKELPMEYAVELNRLISLSMEGAVG